MLRAERAARTTQSSRSGLPQRKSAMPQPAVQSRKRKAGDDQLQERKRTRAEEPSGLPAGFFDNAGDKSATESHDTSSHEIVETPSMTEPPTPGVHTAPEAAKAPASLPSGFFDNTAQQPVLRDAVDEDEWAAFERDVATPPPVRTTIAALSAAATIEAAPMSAEELAAQAREQRSAQRGRKDIEVEAEREDAARHLEEEFDQMDELEAKVRSLREKREALRQGRLEPASTASTDDAIAAVGGRDSGEESDDALDEDDFDDWRFRAA